MVPMVENGQMAEDVVKSIRYPFQQPQSGMRGCAVPMVRASGWGMETGRYLKKTMEDLLVVVQVESPTAVDNIGDIARVDGVDMIFLGPLDLSASIGKMAKFQDPEVKALLSNAEEAVIGSGCMLGGFRPPGRDLNEMFHKAGYSLVAGSADMGLLRDVALQDIKSATDARKHNGMK